MSPLLRPADTLCFTNEAGTLYYNAAGYVRLGWSSHRVALASIQAFYEEALRLLLRTNTTRVLSEHGQRQPIPAEAQHWLTGNWIPRAVEQAGVSHTAIVEGADPLHRLSTQAVVSAAPAGMVFGRFGTLAEAESWLLR